ncbi:MAG: hydrogenase maturation nickel metallochaperone HypA [Chlorobi bacterium]|nr:hydrogenase maturation nickel metallochaperone HypA [Chlorobiota bacterium]
MHELSLAKDIIEAVYQNVPASEIINVKQVVIKAGQFSGVVADSLKFSFEAITANTDLENAELKIIEIPFYIKCGSCGKKTTNEFSMMVCEECSSANTKIISGTELEICEVKLEETEKV